MKPEVPKDKYQELMKDRWKKLNEKQRAISGYTFRNFLAGIFLIFISLVIYFIIYVFQYYVYKNEIIYLLTIPFVLIGIYYLIKPFLKSPKEEDIELQILEMEMAIPSGDSNFAVERRAEMRLRIHSNELRMYYSMILDQSGKIFNIGIAAMLIGFSIIGFTLYVLLKYRNTMDFDEELLTAILGTVAGILSNFIAVIYLQMHAKTIECLREFHKRMVFTNNMYISNLMASKISNEKLRYRTYRDVAKLLVQDKGK